MALVPVLQGAGLAQARPALVAVQGCGLGRGWMALVPVGQCVGLARARPALGAA